MRGGGERSVLIKNMLLSPLPLVPLQTTVTPIRSRIRDDNRTSIMAGLFSSAFRQKPARQKQRRDHPCIEQPTLRN